MHWSSRASPTWTGSLPPEGRAPRIVEAECLLPAGPDPDATLQFFLRELGFRLDSVTPADDPTRLRLSGHGLRLALDRGYAGAPGALRLTTPDGQPREPMTAPNGTRIEFAPANPPLATPEPHVQACIRPFDDAGWTRGRAGMHYRDLIPDRLGGYLIASHIRIPDGGPVPDDVHYHDVRFQLIYCHRGWVQLVYEDQGGPFVMEAGDCVLQPPHIRHRVLEASAGLEVVELACPAAHMTHLDHEMALPTGRHLPTRDYGGQSFVVHAARNAEWLPLPESGFEARDLGLEAATRGLIRARVLRRSAGAASQSSGCEIPGRGAFVFLFVLRGSVDASLEATTETRLGPGGVVVVPANAHAHLRRCAPDLELLAVSWPG